MAVRIVIEDGHQSWVQDVPDDANVSVGRALSNTIIIEDTAASREHCLVELLPDTGEYWLRDLESRNGTRLNGRFVTKAKLNPGDRIEIGATKGDVVDIRLALVWRDELGDVEAVVFHDVERVRPGIDARFEVEISETLDVDGPPTEVSWRR